MMKFDEGTDPMILMSVVNTRLRDTPKDLEGVCEELGLDSLRLEEILAEEGFLYDPRARRFLPR